VNGVPDYTGTIDTFNGGVSFAPLRSLNLGANANYTDNLVGTLFQGTVAAGAALEPFTNQASHAFDLTGHGSYEIPGWHLTLNGNAEHREQSLFGTSLASNSYTGTVSYSNALLGGFVNGTIGVTENSLSKNQNTTGLLASLGYTRYLGRWNMGASGNYTQNQQTVLISYTTSGFGYSGMVGYNFGHGRYWGASTGISKSSLNNGPGSGSFSQNYSTEFSMRWFSVTGAYNKFSGNSILTSTGLAPASVPVQALLPANVTRFGGRSYSAGIGSSPVRGLTISGSFSKTLSDTLSDSIASSNSTEQINAVGQYLFRKMYFRGGYSKILQGFSAAGTPPSMLSSFYIGVSRWFSLF
jgi:hypothetical protein